MTSRAIVKTRTERECTLMPRGVPVVGAWGNASIRILNDIPRIYCRRRCVFVLVRTPASCLVFRMRMKVFSMTRVDSNGE